MKRDSKPTKTHGRTSPKLSVARQALKDLTPKKQVKGGTGDSWEMCNYSDGCG
jgi:hypothetical protein